VKPQRIIGRFFLLATVSLVLLVGVGLAWLSWDARQSRDDWFVERHGALDDVMVSASITSYGQLSETVTLSSTSGLRVNVRSIRDADSGEPQPVFLVLGGHRTGRDSVDLFKRVDGYAVVGIDYPYDGPEKVRGLRQTLQTLPLARRAILETFPAVRLVVDWLDMQPWADADATIIVGASLGVPFATAAAAQEPRIDAAILAHGAAELRPWLETQVARRIDARIVQSPMSTLLYWLSYGPIFDPGLHVQQIAPRPLVVIGARDDERTPAEQVELLFELAGEPKRLEYTEGMHVEPDRDDIIDALLRVATDMLPFLTQSEQEAAGGND
jgi:dienelactone hydrolase